MLLPIKIGTDLNTNEKVVIPSKGLARHCHIYGATGTGKSVAINTILRPIMMEPRKQAAMFVVDPLGGLSRDLLMWIAGPRCPEHVRERLVYIEAANQNIVLPFNPLQSAVGDSCYYHVARAVDLVMRAWSSQDLSQMARLMQWSYAVATVLAELKLPLSLGEYLLHDTGDEHKALLRIMPDRLRSRWHEILKAKGSEPTRILESTRNRFDPLFSAPQTRRMFGVQQGRFNCEQLILERKIVIINVATQGELSQMLGNTIGALMLNEIFETAFRMASTYGRSSVDPTMIVMDEFQKFVGPDIENAIPTVRQAGMQLVMANQSYSQLIQGDLDLSTMIWQAQNRLCFANAAEDADIMANEFAVLDFNPKAIKEEIFTRKQRIAGHRIEWLESIGESETRADSRVTQTSHGKNQSTGTSEQLAADQLDVVGHGRSGNHGTSSGSTEGETHAVSSSRSRNRSQQLVPIHEDIEELSSRQYYSFDEQRLAWMKTIRQLKTGQCFGKFVDDDELYRIQVDHKPVRETPRAEARLAELLQRNFEQSCFISSDEADRETERLRQEILQPPRIVVQSPEKSAKPAADSTSSDSLFRQPPTND